MFDEDDLVPLSALQHLLFCERQCALIHLENQWAENKFTALGEHLHERAHKEGFVESRGSIRIARGVRLRSLRLGLAGKADVIEFHRLDAEADDETPSAIESSQPGQGVSLPDAPGLWRPFPVEYKRGRPKRNRCDEVQLCAQALCLEEMLGVAVPAGALFYGATRRRFDVAVDAMLRSETESAAARLHTLMASGVTPRAVKEPKCDNCSLLAICMPGGTGPARSAARYTRDALSHLEAAGGGE
jgi:CRISPR-associated exonuclease Cas4